MTGIKPKETYCVCLNEKNNFEISSYEVKKENFPYLLDIKRVSGKFEWLVYCFGKDIGLAKKILKQEKIAICKKEVLKLNKIIDDLVYSK